MADAAKKKVSKKTRDRLKPKDPHLSGHWMRRNAARKPKQEAFALAKLAAEEAATNSGE
jgi:hypothetical protein